MAAKSDDAVERRNRGDAIVIGTRGSDLARAQAAQVAQALREKGGIREIETTIITTSGDEDVRLEPSDLRAGRKGMFTREIERALLSGAIDIAVHSAKDLPSEMTMGLRIAATLPRARTSDLFLSRERVRLRDLPVGAIVATSSVRRRHQLVHANGQIEVVELRGNVPTRLRKLAENGWSGIVLARAGLERLRFVIDHDRMRAVGAEFSCEELLPPTFLPAGGQGVIAVQTRADADDVIGSALAAIDHEPTSRCLRAEREFLRLLNVDCNAPVGALSTVVDGAQTLCAQIFEPDKSAPRSGSVTSQTAAPEELARELYEQIQVR